MFFFSNDSMALVVRIFPQVLEHPSCTTPSGGFYKYLYMCRLQIYIDDSDDRIFFGRHDDCFVSQAFSAGISHSSTFGLV